jgi:dynein heavy chain
MSFTDIDAYIETAIPAESPVLFGLHPNAEIGYLETLSSTIFQTVLNISGGGGGGGGNSGVAAVMTSLMERLPASFVMLIVNEIALPKLTGPHSPYVVVAMQECGRMNALLDEMRLTLSDLDKGLKGQLNMTDVMEDMIVAMSINEWPGRNPFSKCTWEKNAWPSKKGLQSQFLDLLERYDVIKKWSDDMISPLSLWLPGLFNPTAYLTAIKQVTARATQQPLDNMTNETHFTTMFSHTDAKLYPEDGMFIHGLFMEGSRWSSLADRAGPLAGRRRRVPPQRPAHLRVPRVHHPQPRRHVRLPRHAELDPPHEQVGPHGHRPHHADPVVGDSGIRVRGGGVVVQLL